MEEDLLTYAEAADMLGLELSTLYTLVSRRTVPHIRFGRRLVRFRRRELRAWVDERAVPPISSSPPANG